VEARLAALLLSLSTRLRNHGFSATELNLSMSKYDIANFLGVAPETVSWLFARLVREGVLSIDGKLVCIKDIERCR
jgi:CRP/FNR family transcriptional regulator, anaerobic regulatory protein